MITLAGKLEEQNRERKIVVARKAIEAAEAPVLKLGWQEFGFRERRAKNPLVRSADAAVRSSRSAAASAEGRR